MIRRLASALLVAATLAACEQPPVEPTADRRQNIAQGRIEGDLVVTGTARGNAVLFLFDAARPPAPDGTGRPVAFTFVPAEAIYGAAMADTTQSGPFTAPYVFSQVAPGNYLIKGFIDAFGGTAIPGRLPDFKPWYGVTAEGNRGDVGGAAVDAVTRQIRIVSVRLQEDATVSPVTGVTVTFQESALTVFPADRPAFQVQNAPITYNPGGVTQLQLAVNPIQNDLVDQRGPAFLVRCADTNGDTFNDTVVWPRVFVRKLAADAENPALLLDENDRDKNGILDADGIEYAHETPGAEDDLPDLVVLPAGFHPSACPAGAATEPRTSLTLLVMPGALNAANPAAPLGLAAVPPGKYAVVVMQATGQTWRVPNELSTANVIGQPISVADYLGMPGVASQSFVLTVP